MTTTHRIGPVHRTPNVRGDIMNDIDTASGAVIFGHLIERGA